MITWEKRLGRRLNSVFQQFLRVLSFGTILSIITTAPALADGVRVTVFDREGEPVPNVAVYIDGAGSERAPAGTNATMDQVDLRFVPHLLVVQSGTSVDFPNSDTVAHHVYSFSHPNHFKLPIYKGDAHPPVTFNESGIVVLGCNIHDQMLAYILVVDTPTFAMTNGDGIAMLDAQPGKEMEVSIWSPRIRDKLEFLSVAVEPTDIDPVVTFKLKKSLRAPFDSQSEALSWSEY